MKLEGEYFIQIICSLWANLLGQICGPARISYFDGLGPIWVLIALIITMIFLNFFKHFLNPKFPTDGVLCPNFGVWIVS